METDGYDQDDWEEEKAFNDWQNQGLPGEWRQFIDEVEQSVVDEEDRLELRRRLMEAQGE